MICPDNSFKTPTNGHVMTKKGWEFIYVFLWRVYFIKLCRRFLEVFLSGTHFQHSFWFLNWCIMIHEDINIYNLGIMLLNQIHHLSASISLPSSLDPQNFFIISVYSLVHHTLKRTINFLDPNYLTYDLTLYFLWCKYRE